MRRIRGAGQAVLRFRTMSERSVIPVSRSLETAEGQEFEARVAQIVGAEHFVCQRLAGENLAQRHQIREEVRWDSVDSEVTSLLFYDSSRFEPAKQHMARWITTQESHLGPSRVRYPIPLQY